MLPEDFAYVRDIIPDAFEDIRYAGSHNFMGRPACGYGAARAVLTLPAALALKKAAAHFGSKGLLAQFRRSCAMLFSLIANLKAKTEQLLSAIPGFGTTPVLPVSMRRPEQQFKTGKSLL